MYSKTYRGFSFSYWPKPIPWRGADWDFVHEDYNGSSSDSRCGTGSSIMHCKQQIDEILLDLAEQSS